MILFGIAGWSGSGKTTLLVRLIPALVARGIEVATIKHTHHDPAFGGQSGAVETVIAAPDRFAVVHEHHGATEPGLDALAARLAGVDLILVEGFKFSPHPKLEVHDPALGKPPLALADPSVKALACDHPVEAGGIPRFARDDGKAIADFIFSCCGLARR